MRTDDQAHPKVAIMDAALARQLFPSKSPLGEEVRFGVQPAFQKLQVVGIAQRARVLDLHDSAPVIYVPVQQFPDDVEGGTLLVRGARHVDLTKAVSSEIQSFGYEYAASPSTLEEKSQRSLGNEYISASLSSVFAGIALLVTAFGVFGLTTYLVNLRRREIAIRMAVGSQRSGIVALIVRESLVLSLLGVGIGLPCALMVSRMLSHMLFALSFFDPLTLVMACLTVLLTGAAAGLAPAFQAARLNLTDALRQE